MKLVFTLLLATVAVAQTPVPKPSTCKPNGEGCVTIPTPTSNYIVTTAPSRPDLEVKDALAKDGSHTVIITDSGNHWRCIITGSVPVHPGNSWYRELSSFTLVCFDTKLVSEPTPPSAKEGK